MTTEEKAAKAGEAECSVCGGKLSEHNANTKHRFTTVEGDLEPAPQHAKKTDKPSDPSAFKRPRSTPDGVNAPSLNRLVKVLHRNGSLSADEVLEVIGFAEGPLIEAISESPKRSARQAFDEA